MKADHSGAATSAEALTELPLSEWHYLAGAFDRETGSVELYVDGRLVASAAAAAGSPADASDRAVLANRVVGGLDEVRLASTARDATWFALQYKSMERTLLSYAPARDCPGGN